MYWEIFGKVLVPGHDSYSVGHSGLGSRRSLVPLSFPFDSGAVGFVSLFPSSSQVLGIEHRILHVLDKHLSPSYIFSRFI